MPFRFQLKLLFINFIYRAKFLTINASITHAALALLLEFLKYSTIIKLKDSPLLNQEHNKIRRFLTESLKEENMVTISKVRVASEDFMVGQEFLIKAF